MARLVQLRIVDLDPSPDTTGIDSKSTLDRMSAHMCEREGYHRYHLTLHMIMSQG